MTAYGTDHQAACLARLAELLPGWELVDPAPRYRDSAGWLRGWPRMLRTLSAVIVVPDQHGLIGAGCLRELADAVWAALPVVAFEPGASLAELIGVELLEPERRSSLQAALLVLGDHIDPEWLVRSA
jgi:hypothetical protein